MVEKVVDETENHFGVREVPDGEAEENVDTSFATLRVSLWWSP